MALADPRLKLMGSGSTAVVGAAELGAEADSGSAGGAAAAGVGRKQPSSRYKVVVPQPKGLLGAQIYDNFQRVPLGTFAGEANATRDLDAVTNFRALAVTNFRPLAVTNPVEANAARDLDAVTNFRPLTVTNIRPLLVEANAARDLNAVTNFRPLAVTNIRPLPVEANTARDLDAVTNFRPLAVTNFRPLAAAIPEDAAKLRFLTSPSKTEVVNMQRQTTYFDQLARNRHAFASTDDNNHSSSPALLFPRATAAAREHLFDKTVTPREMSLLNRLLIPKKDAEKHFPVQLPPIGGKSKGTLLMEDAAGMVWHFRYTYWNNSQNYVITKGWCRFRNQKGLQAGDVISFYRSSTFGAGSKLFIDCKLRPNTVAAATTSPVRSAQAPAPVAKSVRLFGADLLTAPATATAPADAMAAGCKESQGRGLAGSPP